MGDNKTVKNNWANPYKNYLDAEQNYSESERKVIDRPTSNYV